VKIKDLKGRWRDEFFNSLEAWTYTDLITTFERVGQLDQFPLRFCLFIDGLGEYNSNHSDLPRHVSIAES
jgi:hypothetical protein